jgi:hypothetical protein
LSSFAQLYLLKHGSSGATPRANPSSFVRSSGPQSDAVGLQKEHSQQKEESDVGERS